MVGEEGGGEDDGKDEGEGRRRRRVRGKEGIKKVAGFRKGELGCVVACVF